MKLKGSGSSSVCGGRPHVNEETAPQDANGRYDAKSDANRSDNLAPHEFLALSPQRRISKRNSARSSAGRGSRLNSLTASPSPDFRFFYAVR